MGVQWGFYPLLCITVPLKDDERMTDDIPSNRYICKTNTESVTEFLCVCTIDICCVYAVYVKLYHLILTSRYIFNLYFITFPCLLFTVKGLKVQYVCLSYASEYAFNHIGMLARTAFSNKFSLS